MKCVKIKDIGKVVSGGTAPKESLFNESEGIPFIRAGHLERLCSGYDINKLPKIDVNNPNIKRQVKVPKNTVIFAKSGMSCMKGRVYKTTEDTYIVNHLAGIICNDNVVPDYLKYYFTIYKPNRLVVDESYPSIRLSDISNIEIFLPSLSIQRKISNILDKAQDLIDKRKEQIEQLDELVKSRFIEMFGNPVINSKNWRIQKMKNVAPTVAYKGDFNENKVWLLNLDMVESNTGNILGYNYVTMDEVGSSTCTFDTTNVLYSKLRPYLNKVVIPNEKGYATSEMVPLKPAEGVLNRYYLTYMLRNKSFVDYISEKVSGAKMPRVTMNDFRDFNVPIPPIELQNQFADFVNQVDKLKFEMEKSLKELEDNFNSLMQKAFKGELF